MDLVIGATGLLGSEICSLLRARGRAVSALVRPSSAAGRLAELERLGVKLVKGDLKDSASLRAACAEADHVVVTASSTLSRAEGDSIDSVDRAGNLALIEAARAAHVKHFVFTSFPPIALKFPLQDAKRAVEQALVASGLPYTILQPPHFFEVWFSPALGFDARARKARIFGHGNGRMNWVSYHDVARVAAGVTGLAAAERRVLTFGGPQALSQREVIAIFEKELDAAFEVELVPELALRQQLESAPDPLSASFAALMLACALGADKQLDNSCLKPLVEFEPTTAHAFARSVVAAPTVS